MEAAAVRRVLDDLERRGLLTDAAIDAVPAGEAAFWAGYGVDPSIAKQRLAATAVSVDAVGAVELTPYLEALRFAGVRVAADAARRVVITDDYLRRDLLRFNQEALSGAREWLLMKPSGLLLWLGPIFRPGRTACWECLAERLRTNRSVENFVAQRIGEAEPLARAPTISAMGEQIGAGIAASTVAAWLARDAAPELDGALVTLDLRSWRSETHRVVARPQCRACGDPPEVVAAAAPPIALASRRKTFTSDGGHRTRAPEATLERFQHHVSPISGIVPSLARSGTPRDSVVHAYVAGANPSRPLRTLAMLGEGLRSRVGGKGASDAQARASALCEALERYSGVFQGDEPRRQARLGELGGAAIHPNACMGFSDRQYRERAEWNERREMTRAVPLPFEEDARDLLDTGVVSQSRRDALPAHGVLLLRLSAVFPKPRSASPAPTAMPPATRSRRRSSRGSSSWSSATASPCGGTAAHDDLRSPSTASTSLTCSGSRRIWPSAAVIWRSST